MKHDIGCKLCAKFFEIYKHLERTIGGGHIIQYVDDEIIHKKDWSEDRLDAIEGFRIANYLNYHHVRRHLARMEKQLEGTINVTVTIS